MLKSEFKFDLAGPSRMRIWTIHKPQSSLPHIEFGTEHAYRIAKQSKK